MVMGLFIFRFLLLTNLLVFSLHPTPDIQTADDQSDQEQHQRPRVSAREMVVDPEAEGDPQQRGKRHRPTNESEHPETKPNASWPAALRFKLASLLRSHLATEGRLARFCLSSFIHVGIRGNGG